TASGKESPLTSNSALVPCNGSKVEKSSGNLSYDWAYGASPLAERPELKDRVSVTANGALLINRFSGKDHGKYTCRVRDGNSVVEEVTVDVDDKYRLLAEVCHPSGCISAEKCDSPSETRTSCLLDGEVCCSVVREDAKHRCGHFLGECMKSCTQEIQVLQADDCEEGTTCCVLVY
ncbi:hypothetical protein TSAR_002752, partial [Trichomalopsis sarcophagae]